MNMTVEVDFGPGTLIDDAISEALAFSQKNECWVRFNANGVDMIVKHNFEDISRKTPLQFHSEVDFYKGIYNKMIEEKFAKENKMIEEKLAKQTQTEQRRKATFLVNDFKTSDFVPSTGNTSYATDVNEVLCNFAEWLITEGKLKDHE